MRHAHARVAVRRGLAVATTLAAAVAVAACGSDETATPRGERSPGAGVDTSDAAAQRFAGLPIDSIAAAVQGDMERVSTIQAHVVGVHSGHDVTADVSLDADSDCVGTFEIGAGRGEVLRVGEAVYASFDAPLLEELGHSASGAAAIVEATGDRWVQLGEGNVLTDVAVACQATVEAVDVGVFTDETLPEVEVAGLTELDDVPDVPVLELTRTTPEGTTTVWVNAISPHRYVEVSAPREGQPFVVDQVVYDPEVVVPDPLARGVVDAGQVGLG